MSEAVVPGRRTWDGNAAARSALQASAIAWFVPALIDAVLIMVFAAVALRNAMARRIGVHRRWALRTFMAVSGVWFTRVIYSFLDIVAPATPGIAGDMTGPTNIVIGFASYLLPLGVLELYFLAQRRPSVVAKFATAGLVLGAAGATGIGVYGRVTGWLK